MSSFLRIFSNRCFFCRLCDSIPLLPLSLIYLHFLFHLESVGKLWETGCNCSPPSPLPPMTDGSLPPFPFSHTCHPPCEKMTLTLFRPSFSRKKEIENIILLFLFEDPILTLKYLFSIAQRCPRENRAFPFTVTGAIWRR